MRQMLTQAQSAGQYSTIDLIKDTTRTVIATLSLHDALPISFSVPRRRRLDGPEAGDRRVGPRGRGVARAGRHADRKSTRLNSSHLGNSYAVFCLKKKSWSLS